MTNDNPQAFDGFITPDGELISIHDVDKVFSYMAKRHDKASDIADALWAFAGESRLRGHSGTAHSYYERILTIMEDPGHRAECLLAMGQIREESGDHAAAADTYARAFDLEQQPDQLWYFLNNNLGYCLNQLGRHKEAAGYCRAAIRIDRHRHNAHKNLGVALQGMGQYAEAAKAFLRADRGCPEDGRALEHLKNLVSAHPRVQYSDGVRRALQGAMARKPPTVQ